MRALVYHGPGTKAWEEVPKPTLQADTDASPTSECTASRPRCTSRSSGSKNITITTGLVDTYSTPTLLQLTTSHQVDAGRFVTHHFHLDQFIEAYDVFARAADTGALKVVLTRQQ